MSKSILKLNNITYSSLTYRFLSFVFSIFSEIKWPRLQAFINGGVYWSLTETDHNKLRGLLRPHYYFILTRRTCHLTTYLIGIASLIATGKRAHYTHALMNVDNGKGNTDDDFKLIEATGEGVHYSTFLQVFDCDSVVLLTPKNVSKEDWVKILDKAYKESGKPYDDLFNVLDDTHLSCIELCRASMQALPDYDVKFPAFEKMIADNGYQLTPQMLYECPDFEIAFEVRR